MSTPDIDGWFDDAGNKGAPSAAFKNVGDSVVGEVVEQFAIDYIPFGKKDALVDEKTGEVIKQLVIVLQTELRDWAGVSKIPKDANDNEKPASEDDGRRAIYVRKYTNIHAAVGAMLQAAAKEAGVEKLKVRNGGRLGIQFYKDEDTGKGNPLKHFRGKYTPPAPSAASDDFFNEPSKVAESAPASKPAEAAPAKSEPADPWASAAVADEPPF